MIGIEDLVAALRELPASAELTNWELTHDGCGCYTLVLTVIFTLADGRPPSALSITAALSP